MYTDHTKVFLFFMFGIFSLEYDETPITDEEERPLSQGELRMRIVKGVSKFNTWAVALLYYMYP